MRPDEIRRRRATAQRLMGGQRGGAAEVVPRLLAVQAHDLMSARLAVRARSTGMTASDVDRALADADRAVARMSATPADEGPLTRPALAERLTARGIRTEVQRMPHLLMLAALRGVLVLGPVRDDGQAFVLTRDRLDSQAQQLTGGDRDRAPGLA